MRDLEKAQALLAIAPARNAPKRTVVVLPGATATGPV